MWKWVITAAVSGLLPVGPQSFTGLTAAAATDPLAEAPADVTRDVIEGEVVSVNPLCRTILVEDHSGSVDLLITPKTEVFVERERVTDLAAIPKGLFVRAYFHSSGDAARVLLVKSRESLPTSQP